MSVAWDRFRLRQRMYHRFKTALQEEVLNPAGVQQPLSNSTGLAGAFVGPVLPKNYHFRWDKYVLRRLGKTYWNGLSYRYPFLNEIMNTWFKRSTKPKGPVLNPEISDDTVVEPPEIQGPKYTVVDGELDEKGESEFFRD